LAFGFPARFEEETVLRHAMSAIPKDAHAPYLLGCLLYDRRPADAIEAWEESRRRDDTLASVHRNLGLAYAQQQKDTTKAIVSLERAVALDPNEPRFLYELDTRYEAEGTPVAHRLAMLTGHQAVVAQRDDALEREIVLLTVAGVNDPAKLDRAIELLTTRTFHNWEGRSELHRVQVVARLTRGQLRLRAGQPKEAIEDFEAALEYPENQQVGRPASDRKSPEVEYFIGLAYAAAGNADRARASFESAVRHLEGGASSLPFHQALALQKLGRADEARRMFERLVTAGEDSLQRGAAADYFAKFGERQSERVRQANAHFVAGLGRWGLDDSTAAGASFRKAVELNPAHLGAVKALAGILD